MTGGRSTSSVVHGEGKTSRTVLGRGAYSATLFGDCLEPNAPSLLTYSSPERRIDNTGPRRATPAGGRNV